MEKNLKKLLGSQKCFSDKGGIGYNPIKSKIIIRAILLRLLQLVNLKSLVIVVKKTGIKSMIVLFFKKKNIFISAKKVWV